MIKIRFGNQIHQVESSGGELLSELIRSAGLMPDLRCGGSGICGRCRVRLVAGTFSIQDRRVEAAPGRPVDALSCRTRWEGGEGEIAVPADSVIHSDGQIAVNSELLHLPEPEAGQTTAPDSPLGLAVDIGTTTVAVALLDLGRNRILATASAYNRQSQYGDNVTMRISCCAEDGKLELLRSLVTRETIDPLIRRLLADTGRRAGEIGRVSVAGNTVMSHLFLGISPESIGVYPFRPEFRVYPQRSAAECKLTACPSAPVVLLPSVSGYVGGDLTAGILAADLDRFDGTRSLLIDIGTNCEIILNDGERLHATAAAAGPAFEGAGIFCGSRAAAGAIDHIAIDRELNLTFDTIGGEAPAGLCGSALVDFLAEGFSRGLINPFGCYEREKLKSCGRHLSVDYGHGPLHAAVIAAGPEGNSIYVSEADIEQALKAKAAVYSGITLLLSHARLEIADLDRVYLAGGFANYLNVANATVIGMLPPVAPEKIRRIGNSSLAGAVMNLCDPDFYRRALELIDLPEVVELNLLPEFEDSYIDALMIPNFDPDRFYGRREA